ncbi:MAG: hypothetical protein WCS97_01855 [Candidatus Paceibacterota bacterium]|jgi:hypothetical protein
MKRIVIVVLALFATLAMASVMLAAPIGKPFLHGVKTPAELADKVQASLAKNPKGTSIIDPERCKRDGSCASPANYFEMFKESDPEARLTDVAQVPAFLKRLEIAPAPEGEYWISCLKPSGKDYKPVLHCLSRPFKKGEKAWVDPQTKRIVLASDCTNPVEKPAPKKEACVEIHFFTKQGDSGVRFALLGPKDVKDDCIAVKRAGEEDFEQLWADECSNVHCDFSADAAVVGQPVRIMGSYVPVPGEHILRLPTFVAEKSLYVTVLCLERGSTEWPEFPKSPVSFAASVSYGEKRQEWIAGHSDAIGVRWFDYLNTKSEVKRATVYYTKPEIPKGAPQLYWPWGEWGKQ